MSNADAQFDAPWEVPPQDGIPEGSPAPAENAATSKDTEPPVQEPAEEDSQDDVPVEKAPIINEIALEFIGFWNRLVSQTNWEKGKVIHTWRTRLIEAGLPRSVYSDESIAQRIGNISSQHVGRLRRVYERFGDENAYRNNDKYINLYWSHYQAVLDWEDADTWLDKASSEGLSVAQMRVARWEKNGAPANRKPKDEDIVISEKDEDVNPMNDSDAEFVDILPATDPENKDKKKKGRDGGEEGQKKSDDESEDENEGKNFRGSDEPWESPRRSTSEILRDMGSYPELPEDLAGPIGDLKEAILNYKLADWDEVSREDVLKWLNALRGIVVSEE